MIYEKNIIAIVSIDICPCPEYTNIKLPILDKILLAKQYSS